MRSFFSKTAVVAIYSLVTVTSGSICAESASAPAKLEAEFTQNVRCPVFKGGETVEIAVHITGPRVADDVLIWAVSDWLGHVVDSGKMAVPAEPEDWTGSLRLKSYGGGYFSVGLKLDKSGVMLAALGSRPAGILTYSVLPDIEPLPLAHSDDSRFGAQGEASVRPGEPYYLFSLVGMKWVYRARRLYDLATKKADDYQPVLDPVKAKETIQKEGYTGMCVFVDAHSLPQWLTKLPEGMNPEKWWPSATLNWQCYAPNDFGKYEEFIGKIAAEQLLLKKAALPDQSRNYYEIHWEPDWHWKGTDEEFIAMYEHARAAIKKNDPDGLLLGANYGVLAEGNKQLERLFKKGLGKHLDGVVTHTYYLPMLRRSPEQAGMVEGMQKLATMTKQYVSPAAPLINSEWGVSCPDYFGVTPLRDVNVLTSEAAWFIRGHMISLGEGARTTFFFYLVDHDVFGLFFNLEFPKNTFNSSKVAPKPVFAAAAAMTRLLEGTKNLGRIDYLGKNVLGYAFDRNGQNIAAIWSMDEKERTVAFPCGVEKVQIYDFMGNRSFINCKDGAVILKIGACPIYIAGFSSKALPVQTANYVPASVMAGNSASSNKSDASYRFQLYTGENMISCGNSNAFVLPRNTPPGRWSLGAVSPKGEWAGSQYLTVLPAVELTFDPEKIGSRVQSNSPRLTIRVKNRSDTEAKGVVKILSTTDEVIESATVNVLPRAEVSVPCALSKLPSSVANGSLLVRYAGVDGVVSEGTVEVERSYSVARLSKTLTIDGDLGKWPLENFQTSDTASAMKVNGADWAGPQDLSYRYSIRYDDNILYVAVKVRDQDFCQLNTAENAWMGDSVQLGVAIGRQENGWKSFVSYSFAVNSKRGARMAYRHYGAESLPPCEVGLGKIKFAFKRVGDESNYEIAIPWRELNRSLQGPPADRVIGIGLMVNDADSSKDGATPRKAMESELLGGMENINPENFGLGTLD